jgi:hypothetical protein
LYSFFISLMHDTCPAFSISDSKHSRRLEHADRHYMHIMHSFISFM